MVIYEVNLVIQADIQQAYLSWLKAHIPEVLALDGFMGARCYEVETEGPELALTVHYSVETREHLETYFEVHASKLRGDGLTRFEGKFSAERRIYSELAR